VALNPSLPEETARYQLFVVTLTCAFAAAGVNASGFVQSTIMMRTERVPVRVMPEVEPDVVADVLTDPVDAAAAVGTADTTATSVPETVPVTRMVFRVASSGWAEEELRWYCLPFAVRSHCWGAPSAAGLPRRGFVWTSTTVPFRTVVADEVGATALLWRAGMSEIRSAGASTARQAAEAATTSRSFIGFSFRVVDGVRH